MADISPITLFGVPLADLNDPAEMAGAFYRSEEEINPAELTALIENAGALDADLLGKLRDVGLDYIQTGDRIRLERLLRGIDKGQWLQIRRRVQQTLTHPHFRRFTPSGDLQRVQGGYEGKIRKAFERIVVKALFGDATALDHLRQIAGGQSKMAMAAQVVLDRWEKLRGLARETNPLAFAKKSAAICKEEYEKILEEMERGGFSPEALGLKLLGLHYGLQAGIEAVDDKNQREKTGWQHKGAQAVIRDRVSRPLNSFGTAGIRMVNGEWDTAKVFLKLQNRLQARKRLIAVIHSALAENILFAMAKGVDMRTDNVPDGVKIKAEEAPVVEEALTELIYNAVKYGAKNIVVDWEKGLETLTVADDGIGIADTKVIWKEGPTSRQAPDHAQGRGMGLAIVKRKLEAIGWTISVTSIPGSGTTFTLQKSLTEQEQIAVRVNFGANIDTPSDWDIAEGNDLVEARLALGRWAFRDSLGRFPDDDILAAYRHLAEGNFRISPLVQKALVQWELRGDSDHDPIAKGEESEGLRRDIFNCARRFYFLMLMTEWNIDIEIPEGVQFRDGEDMGLLTAVLTELLKNAFKYRDETKERRFVKVKWDNDNNRFEISDNGLGIKDTEAVFRGVREHTGRAEGEGIGLEFHRRKLRESGWDISVQSTPGVGTTFTLTPPEEAMISNKKPLDT